MSTPIGSSMGESPAPHQSDFRRIEQWQRDRTWDFTDRLRTLEETRAVGTAVAISPTSSSSEVVPQESPELALARQLIAELQIQDTQEEAKAKIDHELRRNKANRYFFWFLYGMQVNDAAICREGYENLCGLAVRYLSRSHKSPFKIGDWDDWDDLIHHTLFGSDRVKGEAEKYLHLPPEVLLENALKNRYSGILTRLKQRHIDALRKHRFEHRDFSSPTARPLYGEESESIVGPDETVEHGSHDISDRPIETVGGLTDIPDPRFGLPGLGASADATERIFQNPIAIVEWAGRFQHIILSEAGETASRTWEVIAEALRSEGLDLEGLNIAGVRKALLKLIAETEGITKPAVAKRLDRLRESSTLKQSLMDESVRGDRYQAAPPRLIRVGKSQRKKIGTEFSSVPDRNHTEPHAAAE
jgi:hypothetical protein